jgi:peroxidase
MGEFALSPYRGYNPLAFPNLSNVFSTAAYRFGHRILDSEILRMENDGTTHVARGLSLRAAFFDPSNFSELGVDPYLNGLTTPMAQEIDTNSLTMCVNL